MKHIALLLPAMRIGGAEKVCLNFLKDLTRYYRVTMILTVKEGDLLSQVPNEVEILEDRLMTFKEIVKNDLKSGDIVNIFRDIIYYLKIKTGNNSEKNYRYLISRTPKRTEYYDCAISYVANVSTQIFCLNDRINANCKIAWIHGETTELKDTQLFESCYKNFNKIYTVSNVTKEHFIFRFPACKLKTDVYYNRIVRDEILEKSKEILERDFDCEKVNIVTVGRFSPEKGFDMIPDVVKRLNEKGAHVHWYVIGDGSTYASVQDRIEKIEVEKYITLLGNKMNPYPYIKSCDIYVQPSYEEGYSTTICEAGILGRAIVGTTTSGGIREQIQDGISGVLAEPNSESIASKIYQLISNLEFRNELQGNVKNIDFAHENEIEKLNSFLNNKDYE